MQLLLVFCFCLAIHLKEHESNTQHVPNTETNAATTTTSTCNQTNGEASATVSLTSQFTSIIKKQPTSNTAVPHLAQQQIDDYHNIVAPKPFKKSTTSLLTNQVFWGIFLAISISFCLKPSLDCKFCSECYLPLCVYFVAIINIYICFILFIL